MFLRHRIASSLTAVSVPTLMMDDSVWRRQQFVRCDEFIQEKPHVNLGRRVDGLPSYTFSEIEKHKGGESVWVTFQEGVYDITKFVEKHPGGTQKILLGAGKSIEPYWKLYGQHLSLPHISHMLEEMRVGNVDETEYKARLQSKEKSSSDDDPYKIDSSIERHPGLVFLTERPANAEVPPSLLCDSFLTPNELFFVRHHFPVPSPDEVGADVVTLTGCPEGQIKLSVKELREKFNQHTVIATIQCTGNRRTGFHSVQDTPGKVKGLPWTVGAISNAKWTGVRLRDVILHIFPNGIPSEIKHVCFEGRDNDGSGQYYGVSIQIDRALDERSDVILAFEMNDQPLPLDHGYPVRLIVPGTAGCRSVKWLKSIEFSKIESNAFWQKEDYKSFSPSQGWEGLDFSSAPSVMSTPVQSAICDVSISDDGKYAILKGYSYSGGGLGIIRVDVSADGGKTWTNASELEGEHENVTQLPYRRTYSWTLWKAVVDLPSESPEFIVKAIDEGYNSQPESPASVWNVRGILNSSWHRVSAPSPKL
jgi:sulfite oxidase